jgi:hypothetical protein
MISLDRMTDEDFEQHALAILQRELGLDELARFLRLNSADGGDYTRDRRRWLDRTSIEEIMTEVARSARPGNIDPRLSESSGSPRKSTTSNFLPYGIKRFR